METLHLRLGEHSGTGVERTLMHLNSDQQSFRMQQRAKVAITVQKCNEQKTSERMSLGGAPILNLTHPDLGEHRGRRAERWKDPETVQDHKETVLPALGILLLGTYTNGNSMHQTHGNSIKYKPA